MRYIQTDDRHRHARRSLRHRTLALALILLCTVVLPVSGGLAAGAPEPVASKALVVYFSCTGNTRSAAEALAELTGADVREIVPQEPYTPDDLNYNRQDSRANREIDDAAARPAISGEIENWADYTTVYLGYPIWWGDLPPILRTFLDSYDFTGKVVLPFCTSGGSGVAASVRTIRAFLPDADVRDGLRVTAASAESAFGPWLEKEEK